MWVGYHTITKDTYGIRIKKTSTESEPIVYKNKSFAHYYKTKENNHSYYKNFNLYFFLSFCVPSRTIIYRKYRIPFDMFVCMSSFVTDVFIRHL